MPVRARAAAAAAGGRAHSMHYARIGRAFTQIRPRRKMHDFGDLGRALETVALLPGVVLRSPYLRPASSKKARKVVRNARASTEHCE